MKKAYITGATGTIGMALVAQLLEKGVQVRVLVREDSPRIRQLDIFKKSIEAGKLIIENIGLEELASKGQDITECKKGSIVFYHLGWMGTFGEARNDINMQKKNVQYTLDAVMLAKKLGCDTFIGAGSQAEYGRVSGLIAPDTETNPENEYGRNKLIAGKESRKLCEKLGIRHVWVRILSIYGPYDGSRTMVMSTIAKLKNGEKAELTKGIQTWDYLYSADAARAFYLIGNSCSDGNRVYCLGSGVERPLREYIEKLADVSGADRELLDFGAVAYSDNQVMKLCADITALTRDTGFKPQITFEEGIRKTIDWYDAVYRKEDK